MLRHSESHAGVQHLWPKAVASDIPGDGSPKRLSQPLSPVSQPAEQWSSNIETWIGGIATESPGWNCSQETMPSPHTSTHFKCPEPSFTPPATMDSVYGPINTSTGPLQSFDAWPGMWPVSTTPGHGPFSYPDSPESLSSGTKNEVHFVAATVLQDQPSDAANNSAQFRHVAQQLQSKSTPGPDLDAAFASTRLPPANDVPSASSESTRNVPYGPAPQSPVVKKLSEFNSQSHIDRSARRASVSSIKTKTSTSQKRLSKSSTQPKIDSGVQDFINYTPNDSEKIVTSVTPSGSSRTTARRGKEAAERRKSLISSIVAAVWELDQFLDEQ